MNARLTLAATAFTMMIFAAACGNDTTTGGSPDATTGGSTNASGGKATGPTCALAPASLVNSVLGVSMGEPTETINSVVTVCDYAPTSGSGGVMVRFQTEEDEAGFALARSGFEDSGQPTKDISGFFDQAFSSTLGRGDLAVKTIVVRNGSVEILVTSHASIDKEKELVTKIFEAMG